MMSYSYLAILMFYASFSEIMIFNMKFKESCTNRASGRLGDDENRVSEAASFSSVMMRIG